MLHLTVDGPEGDDQPVKKAGLSTLAGKSEALVTRTKGFCAENRDGSQSQESEERASL